MTGDEWVDVLDQLTAIEKVLAAQDNPITLNDAIDLVGTQAGRVLLDEYMKGRL